MMDPDLLIPRRITDAPPARPRVWVLTRDWGHEGPSLPLAAFTSQARADAALNLLSHADGSFVVTPLDLED